MQRTLVISPTCLAIVIGVIGCGESKPKRPDKFDRQMVDMLRYQGKDQQLIALERDPELRAAFEEMGVPIPEDDGMTAAAYVEAKAVELAATVEAFEKIHQMASQPLLPADGKKPTATIPDDQWRAGATYIVALEDVATVGTLRRNWSHEFWIRDESVGIGRPAQALRVLKAGKPTESTNLSDRQLLSAMKHDVEALMSITTVVLVTKTTLKLPSHSSGTFYPGELVAEARVFSLAPFTYHGGVEVTATSATQVLIPENGSPDSYVRQDFRKQVRLSLAQELKP